MRLPISFEISPFFSLALKFMSEKEASTCPFSSSINWAYICLFERNTAKRGLAAFPVILARIRLWRRILFSFRVSLVILGFAPRGGCRLFPEFSTYNLTFIPNTLPFIGFGYSHFSDTCRKLSNLFFINPAHRNNILLNYNRCMRGKLHFHGVAKTYIQCQRITFHCSLIPHPFDFQPFRIPLENTLNHVGKQRAR